MRERTRLALYSTGPGCIALNTLLLWPLLGRDLSAGDFSDLVGLFSAAALAAPLAALGLHVYLLRFLAGLDFKRRADAMNLARPTLIFFASSSVVSAIGFAVWGGTTWILICVTLINALILLTQGLLRGIDRATMFAWNTFFSQSVSLAAVAVILSAGGSLFAGLLVYCAFSIATQGLSAISLYVTRLPRVDLGTVRTALLFSVPLIPHLVLAGGLVQVMRVALWSGGHTAELPEFHFASLLGTGGLVVTQTIAAHWSTDALRIDETRFMTAIRTARTRLLTVGLLLSGAIIVFRHTVFDAWLPPSISGESVGHDIAALIPALFLQAVADMNQAVLMRSNRVFRISIATVTGVISGVLSFYVLAHVYSPSFSAAAAVSIGIGVRAVTMGIVTESVYRAALQLSAKEWTVLLVAVPIAVLLAR